MDLHKLKNEDIRSFDLKRLKETEVSLRSEMAMMRLNAFKEASGRGSRFGLLRKQLARVLTQRNTLKSAAK